MEEAAISPITATDIARIARDGAWAADGTIRPEASNVGKALIAALRGGPDQIPNDLRMLVQQVLQVATPGFPLITASDGVRLSAHTITLKDSAPHPVIIVPAGWNPVGWPLFEYMYLVLALRGYHVLAYTPRGIGATVQGPGGGWIDGPSTSGGTIDVGGPNDWSDGSTMIDYAQEHFNPSRIGFLGESYGSGISQLVAAHDPDNRVSAVVALSTWGNLATCFYNNETRHLAALTALLDLTGGPVERKFDESTRALLQDFQNGENLEEMIAWGTERASESYVEQTNDRGIPTLFSNTWHEGLFPANQVVRTFEKLTVPKRLNMWIGDHSVPEGAGLIAPPPPGDANVPLREAFAWLDHHLLGVENGVDGWSEVSNQIMFTYKTAPGSQGKPQIATPAVREERSSWSDVTTTVQQLGLTDARDGADGALGDGIDTGWERSFQGGVDTEATAMDKIVDTGQQEWSGNPKIYRTDQIDRSHAIAWVTAPLSAGAATRRIRGAPKLSLTVRSTAGALTLVAYLFDVDQADTARIITHEPITCEVTPDENVSLTWDLQVAAYDVPAGHRLMLVVDSKDPLYSSASLDGDQITISSPSGTPASLALPLG
ncbi:MAG TPA: alpha/beta fold hydrolase [Kofleriaceae bacterium]|nr:alpha/beta fold hydrolase [Kofleriaceae bacterium]